MRKLFIHLGYPRAASTFLSIRFFKKNKTFNVIPKSEVFYDSLFFEPINLKQNILKFNKKKLNEIYKSQLVNVLVNEHFITSQNKAYYPTNLVKELENFDLCFTAMFRNPIDLLKSFYANFNWLYKDIDFENFIKNVLNKNNEERFALLNQILDYQRVINYLKKSGSKYKILFYEDFLRNKSNFFETLSTFFELENYPLKFEDHIQNSSYKFNSNYILDKNNDKFIRKIKYLVKIFTNLFGLEINDKHIHKYLAKFSFLIPGKKKLSIRQDFKNKILKITNYHMIYSMYGNKK